MRTLRTGAAALVLALLAAAPVGATSTAPSPPLTPAVAPPELQALEAKMKLLQVASERYSTRTSGSFTRSETKVSGSGTCAPSAPCHTVMHRRVVRRTKRHLSIAGGGEVTISPFASEQFEHGRPARIVIGSTLYRYEPGGSGRIPARPWVRERVKDGGVPLLALSLPFHGLPGEADFGGSGPYAGLINLLATAADPIVDAGASVVDGQATIRFMAAVSPAKLSPRLSAKQIAALERQLPRETIDVYVSESGLPLRVVLKSHGAGEDLTTTTDLLAVNEPLSIRRPPARRTRSPQRDPSTSATLIVSPLAPVDERKSR